MTVNPEVCMQKAMKMARLAASKDEVPIGAVIVKDNKIIASAHNDKETTKLATGHAEIRAIELACEKLGAWRLSGCSLFTTLEPCVMCSGAIIQARIDEVYFGASDPKGGGLGSLYTFQNDPRLNHKVQVHAGVLADECGELLVTFFKERRKQRA